MKISFFPPLHLERHLMRAERVFLCVIYRSSVGTDKLPDVLPGPMIFHSQRLYKEAAEGSYDMFVWIKH